MSYSANTNFTGGYGLSSYDQGAAGQFSNEVGGIGYGSSSSGFTGDVNALLSGNFAGVQGLTDDSNSVQHWPTDSQGLFQDPNPLIIRKKILVPPITAQTQNIRVRWLQPPPLPPPGPLIIKEVRAPQPPAPPPLRIVQIAAPHPQQSPVVLRENPPMVPQAVPSQTVIHQLQGFSVPPQSTIVERHAAAPQLPRDITLDRWAPNSVQQQRQTIVQRAAAAQQYQPPRNSVIEYAPPQANIVRNFENLGVTNVNPAEYVQQYGASLRGSNQLLQEARAAGVVENISAPAYSGY